MIEIMNTFVKKTSIIEDMSISFLKIQLVIIIITIPKLDQEFTGN